jgi:acyl carrier protein
MAPIAKATDTRTVSNTLHYADVQRNVISILVDYTGRTASAIKPATNLSDLGIDGFDKVQIGDKIDNQSWLHGIEIPPNDWLGCSTVKDIINLIWNNI